MAQQIPTEEKSDHIQSNYNYHQAFAKKLVEIKGLTANTLLIKRSKALLVTCITILVVLAFEALYIIPLISSGNFTTGAILTMVNSIIQLCALLYFIRTKDPENTMLVVRLLLIVSSFGLLFGFFGGVQLIIVSIFIILLVLTLGAMGMLED